MPITPTLQTQVNNLSLMATSIGTQMVSPDAINKMFHLVAKFRDNPALYEEFKKSPENVVLRELGAFGSAGTHFHTADENNNYFPAEAGAADQIMKGKAAPDEPWVRVEVRAGIGPLCWFNCGVCGNTLASI